MVYIKSSHIAILIHKSGFKAIRRTRIESRREEKKKKKRRTRNPCEQLDLSRIVSPRKPFRRRVGETRNERGIDGKIEGRRMDGREVEETSRRVKMWGKKKKKRNRKKREFRRCHRDSPLGVWRVA